MTTAFGALGGLCPLILASGDSASWNTCFNKWGFLTKQAARDCSAFFFFFFPKDHHQCDPSPGPCCGSAATNDRPGGRRGRGVRWTRHSRAAHDWVFCASANALQALTSTVVSSQP